MLPVEDRFSVEANKYSTAKAALEAEASGVGP
jgi:hypothetical protein